MEKSVSSVIRIFSFSVYRECRGNGCSLSADSEIPLGEPRVLLMRSCALSKVLRGFSFDGSKAKNQSSQAYAHVFSANFAADCVKNPCRATARLRIFAVS